MLFIYWLSFKWVFRINLGSKVKYQGKVYLIYNWANTSHMKAIECLPKGRTEPFNIKDNPEKYTTINKKDCALVKTPSNLIGSFKSGVRFYKSSWLNIWMRNGIEPWMRGCNIW